MKLLICLIAAALVAMPQSSQDIPNQKPTDDPDLAKQGKSTKKPPSTAGKQTSEDVPDQKPGTENPGMAKQRRPAPPSPDATGTPKATGSSKSRTSQKKSTSKRKPTDTSK